MMRVMSLTATSAAPFHFPLLPADPSVSSHPTAQTYQTATAPVLPMQHSHTLAGWEAAAGVVGAWPLLQTSAFPSFKFCNASIKLLH